MSEPWWVHAIALLFAAFVLLTINGHKGPDYEPACQGYRGC